MKASLLLACLLFTALVNCESQKGCKSNPCKTGKCIEDAKNPENFTCECSKGMTGKLCDTVDLCDKKNPCKNGEICSLDKNLKPVCNCPLGYAGTNCASRQCEIEEFKGNNTNGEVNIAKNLATNFGAVDKLAKECKVFVDVIKSFTRLTEPEEAVPAKEASIFVGEGVMFKLKDLNGKVICEKDCLKKRSSKDTSVQCFFNGLSKTGLTQAADNAEILENSAKQTPDAYNTNKLSKQVGCQLVDTLPSLPSKLAGKWELAGSKNWEEFLDANDVGWWKKLALKAIKPDMHITNDGSKKWTIHIISTFKSIKTTFTEGVEFSSLSPISGSKTKHMITTEGKNKLIENQVIYKRKPVKVQVIREIVGDNLIQTMKINKVVCVRTYKRKQ